MLSIRHYFWQLSFFIIMIILIQYNGVLVKFHNKVTLNPFQWAKIFYHPLQSEEEQGPQIKKIVLYAYMSGGSTLLGQILSQSDEVFYFYEPYAGFYNKYVGAYKWIFPSRITHYPNKTEREFGVSERMYMMHTLDQLLNCDLMKLGTEVLNHPAMLLGTARRNISACFHMSSAVNDVCQLPIQSMCLENVGIALKHNCDNFMKQLHYNGSYCETDTSQGRLCEPTITNALGNFSLNSYLKCKQFRDNKTASCGPNIQDKCLQCRIRLAKNLRYPLAHLIDIVKLEPHTKLVYSVRDPRAILVSLSHGDRRNWWFKSDDLKTETSLLCKRMKDDYEASEAIQRDHPNTLLQIRYETLCEHQVETVEALYQHIGEQVTDDVYYFINTTMNTSLNVATAWRKKITQQLTNYIDENLDCQFILRKYNYTQD